MRASLAHELARLRERADAYRARAIALDAKLRTLAGVPGLLPLRAQLHASAACIDGAVFALAGGIPARARR